jgi:hypothetical protein
MHWYQSDKNKVLATDLQQNFQRLIGRILHNRNDGAFVRLSIITQKEGLHQARDTLKFFGEKVLALLPSYWPEEG